MNALNETKGFDLDLKFGKFGESWCLALGSEGRMEVKTERKWLETGNLFFEIRDHGKPSGVSVTEAKFWGQVLDLEGEKVGVLVFPVEQLRKNLKAMLKAGHAKHGKGGDDNAVDGIIVPMTRIRQLYLPAP